MENVKCGRERDEHEGIEHDLLRIVAMSAREAQEFAGRDDAPIRIGQASAARYRFGAYIYGFPPGVGSTCRCDGCTRTRDEWIKMVNEGAVI